MHIRLLICDDEPLIREGLASLDWQDFNIDMVGKAKNGEEAFELAKELRPDIIISDIRMPKKDGIWLSEQVKKFIPDIRMVFLTGYNEFEYAQSAVNNGVYSYLLKPIDEDELYSVVNKLAESIRSKRLLAERSEALRRSMTQSKYFLLSYLFTRAKNGILDCELFEISKPPQMTAAVVIHFNNIGDTDNTCFMAFEYILNSLGKDVEFIPFFGNTELVFIFCFSCSERDAEAYLFSVCEKISESIENSFSCEYNIGIGSITDSIEEIEDSYNSAVDALGYCSTLGSGNIIYINDIEPKASLSAYHTKLIDSYIKNLKNGDLHHIKKIVDELFESMRRSETTLYNQQRHSLSLILAISDALYSLDYNPAILFNNTDVWSLIRKSESSEKLHKFILDITDVVISHMEEMQRQKTENIITRVKELVEQNYATDASLETIASQVFISPCYLSVIFKKETNTTFKNYLIQTRMHKACELLGSTDLKIYEIAEKVGYTDTRYFSELFQRTCGKTPSQYRNKNPR